MRRLYQCAAVAALLLGVAPFAAEAQQTVPLGNGLYVGVEAGAIVPQSVSVQAAGFVLGGGTFAASGDLHFDSGPAAGITLGYHITPVIAVEGNFEYAGFDVRSASGTVVVTGPNAGSASGSLGAQGQVHTYNGLVNAIWTPFGPAGRYGISPYIGAGVGFSHHDESLTGIGGLSLLGFSDNNTDFAANGIVGADFPIPFVPQLTAGVRYRLLFINSSNNDSGVLSFGDFIGHVFTANATWHF